MIRRRTLWAWLAAASLALPAALSAEQLPATVTDAVRAYGAGGPLPPVIESPTRKLVPFGAARPELVCAPLRACAIELEEGEALQKLFIGDSERWLVASAVVAQGTPVLSVKPTACNLRTNLLLLTSRRVYDLALVSPACPGGEASADLPYTPLLAFYYPDDLLRSWTERESAATAASANRSATTAPTAAASAEQLSFDYRWKTGRRSVDPLRVYDDGTRTYITLRPEDRQREAPTLFLLADGKLEAVTFEVHGDTYVVPRLFAEAVLVSGPGSAQRTTITNLKAKK